MAKRINCNSELMQILGVRPIAFNPLLAELAHSALAGLFLSQLLYWWRKGSDRDWVYKTIVEFQSETCMTRGEQERAIRIWKDLGILEIELRGVPCTRHFKIRTQRLVSLLRKYMQNGANQFAESDKLVSEYEQTITESTPKNSYKDSSLQDARVEEINARRKKLAKRFRVSESR